MDIIDEYVASVKYRTENEGAGYYIIALDLERGGAHQQAGWLNEEMCQAGLD